MRENLGKILEKANMMDKAEKLTYFVEKIWESLYQDDYTKPENCEKIRTLIVKYMQTSFGAESKEVCFEEMPEDCDGVCLPKKVVLNVNHFNCAPQEKMSDFIKKITNLMVTSSHEFTHHNDEIANLVNGLTKDYISGAEGVNVVIPKLAEFWPENKEKYELLAESLYFLAYCEQLARKISFSATRALIERIEKITNQKLDYMNEVEDRYKKYKEAMAKFDDVEKATEISHFNLTCKLAKFMQMKVKLLKNNLRDIKNNENNLLVGATEHKQMLLESVRKDFLCVCEKFLNEENKSNFFLKPDELAVILNKPEFFDKKIADKLYQYGKETNNFFVKAQLSKVANCEIPQKERKTNLEMLVQAKKIVLGIEK